MNIDTFQKKLLLLLNSIGVSCIETRFCKTNSYDLVRKHSYYPRLTRGTASNLLKTGFTINGKLNVEQYNNALIISTICHLFQGIKEFNKYSQLVSFVEWCERELNLEALNGEHKFTFDHPIPAFMLPLNEFLASDDFENMNWEFTLILRRSHAKS